MISLKFIIGLFVIIVVAHFLALYNHWYWIYQWFDIPMHFFGGFWAAMVVVAIFNFRFPIFKELSVQNFFLYSIIILACVTFVGVLLEFVEFFYDVFISLRGHSGYLQLGAADTIGDLFFDFFGGFIFLIIYSIIYRNKV